VAADTLDQDVKVVVSELRQFHHHRLTEAFRQRSGGDERRLGRALWEGWRRRVVEASREDKFWDAMALSPEAFSTADLLELLRQVDGEETRYGITSERSLLGWHHAFETMVLARLEGTLVLLMGVARLPDLATQLVAHGRAATTPVAVVERGTLPDQRTTTGTLADIAGVAAARGVTSPAVIVVGEVAALHARLG